jgi:hypothetical protein
MTRKQKRSMWAPDSDLGDLGDNLLWCGIILCVFLLATPKITALGNSIITTMQAQQPGYTTSDAHVINSMDCCPEDSGWDVYVYDVDADVVNNTEAYVLYSTVPSSYDDGVIMVVGYYNSTKEKTE